MEDNYLMHYGIKGMKWGVRRAKLSGDSERLSKHFGKAEAKLAKLRAKGKTTKARDFERAMADAFVNTKHDRYYSNDKTRKLLSQMDNMEDAYWKNDKLRNKYQNQLIRDMARKDHKKYGGNYKELYKQYEFGVKKDDLDQGNNSSFERYLKANRKAGAKYRTLQKQMAKETNRLRAYRQSLGLRY